MMNNERERYKAARYVPSIRFEEGLQATLRSLPHKRTKRPQERIMLASGIAAAFVLFCVFAAPPIVRAASALIQRVFGANIEVIDAYEALGEDEKLAQQIAEAEMHGMRYDIGASVQFESMTITLPGMSMQPEDAFNITRKDGFVNTRILYSERPPFDPNWMDFSLSFGGVEYPARLGDGVTEYRKMNLHATTEDDWFTEDFNWYGNSGLFNGVYSTHMFFPVDDWKLTEPTEMTLKGSIDGASFEIPFVFDPQKAHEQAVADAGRGVEVTEEINQEKKQELERLAQDAAPIGLTGRAYGVDYIISELVLLDGKLNLSASISGAPEPSPEEAMFARYLYSIDDVYTDGYPAASIKLGSDTPSKGTYTLIKHCMLGRDPAQLPEESLISLQLIMRERDQSVPLAFRYNWQARRATLPKDEGELQAWIAQANALRDEVSALTPFRTVYNLKPLKLVKTVNGLSMMLTQVEINPYGMDVSYELKRDNAYKNMSITTNHNWIEAGIEQYADPYATVGGLMAEYSGDMWLNNRPKSSTFTLPLHATQIGDNTKLTVSMPMQMYNRKDESVYRETFEFEFALDNESMKPELIWENDNP